MLQHCSIFFCASDKESREVCIDIFHRNTSCCTDPFRPCAQNGGQIPPSAHMDSERSAETGLLPFTGVLVSGQESGVQAPEDRISAEDRSFSNVDRLQKHAFPSGSVSRSETSPEISGA